MARELLFPLEAKELHDVAQKLSECGIYNGDLSALATRAVRTWLETEAPVYLSAMKEARKKLSRRAESQGDSPEVVAS